MEEGSILPAPMEAPGQAPAPCVFVAIPAYGQLSRSILRSTFHVQRRGEQNCVYDFRIHNTSLLTLNFNTLWAQALNERLRGPLTHFAMMHADVNPQSGWLSILLEELRRLNADVVSALIPIKDGRGLTSTAFLNPATKEIKRLTMREASDLPGTFTVADAGYPGWILLPNTGLWVCDFTKPWVEKVCFHIDNRIFQRDGFFTAQAFSEDWHFGSQCHKLGLKVAVTRSVALTHTGEYEFPNDSPWGEWEHDLAKDSYWQ